MIKIDKITIYMFLMLCWPTKALLFEFIIYLIIYYIYQFYYIEREPLLVINRVSASQDDNIMPFSQLHSISDSELPIS